MCLENCHGGAWRSQGPCGVALGVCSTAYGKLKRPRPAMTTNLTTAPLTSILDGDAAGAPSRCRARRRQPLEAQRPACRTQCHVMVGNITRAAHALNSEPLADVNDPIVIAASQTKAP